MYDIITVGEILTEFLYDQVDNPLDKVGGITGPYPSGAPAIMIDQAACLKMKTTIFAKVGDDPFGDLNINRLKFDGVDTRWILKTKDNTTGVAFVTYFSDGSRNFLFHLRNAACGELGAENIDESVFPGSTYLHIMGCSITGSPNLRQAVLRAIDLAVQNKVKISFDPNIRPELMRDDLKDIYTDIITKSDVLLTGYSELKKLLPDIAENPKAFIYNTNKILVIKDGARGTRLYSHLDSFSVPTFSANELDPTGAGDCFDATFLSMLCKKKNLREAVVVANAAGAMAVGKRGPMEGNSSYEEICALIKAQGIPQIQPL